jgi:crotonobetainyl-CoA:carnitine CoA-transferase CaiB-like acyl-CoA transferase
MPTFAVSDMTSSLTALAAILMALYRRRTTGQGDYIDISMLDTLVPWTVPVAESVFERKDPPNVEIERLLGGSPFYGVYRTSDNRFLVLCGSEPKFVESLLTALGRPDLIELCRHSPGPAQHPVRCFLNKTFLTKSRDEWDAWLQKLDVCYAPVNDLAEGLLQDPLRDRQIVIDDRETGFRFGSPINFQCEPGKPATKGPELGEHTDDIFEWLKLFG